jgi:hypothetical protein
LPQINLGTFTIQSINLNNVLATPSGGFVFDGTAIEEEANRIIQSLSNLFASQEIFDFEADTSHGEHLAGHGRLTGFHSDKASTSGPVTYTFTGSVDKL